MQKLISAVGLVAALLAGPARAELFEAWDVDDDGALSEAEFRPGLETAGWFDAWDANDDGRLGPDEFGTGLYELFDADGDDALGAVEWEGGIAAWHGGQGADLGFARWDADGDEAMSREEFGAALGAAGVYAGFAGYDHEVGEDEFYRGAFVWFDEDDGLLTPEEWKPLSGLLD